MSYEGYMVAGALWIAAVGGEAAAPLSEDEIPAETASSQPWFLFDKADDIVEARLLENPLFYDGGIASSKEGLWIAWLEFQPGKGDQLWIGLRGKTGWISKTQLSEQPGDYANPTPTVDADGKLWLSYEAADAQGNWNVFVRQGRSDGGFAAPKQVSQSPGPNISHRVTADPGNGLSLVWQGNMDGRFHLGGARITRNGTTSVGFGTTPMDCWSPSLTVTPDGALHAIWDAYDGTSFNVFAVSMRLEMASAKGYGQLGGLLPLAASPGFEGHAQIASDKDGKIWVLWEEDGENWGKRYTARTSGIRTSTKMNDKIGPLHRYRRLHLAQLDEKGNKLTEYDIPQPSFELARSRTNAPPDLKDFGAFYEHGQLVVDGRNRPWIVYRHFYVPWIGVTIATHKQENMRIYARCLLSDGWAKLYTFKDGQGDGGQRISVSAEPDGIALAWTVGRTDRRKTKDNHGVAFAE
ncbi:MAG: hypothetical protein QOJ40_916, partial [Verrucomicrobiota bacterium]